MSDQDVKVPGEEIKLGKDTYVLPPLPLIKMSSIAGIMTGGSIHDEAYVRGFNDALYYSLKRNYPDIIREMIDDTVDTANFQDILEKFMQVNNFAKKDEQSGEAQASR